LNWIVSVDNEVLCVTLFWFFFVQNYSVVRDYDSLDG